MEISKCIPKAMNEWLKEEDKGNSVLKSMYRILGIRIAMCLRHTSITPNQLTSLSFIFGLLTVCCIAFLSYPLLILGAVFLQLSLIVDYADGSLARMKKMTSKFGHFFDMVSDDIVEALIYFAIVLHLYRYTNSILPWVLGFSAVCLIFLTRLEENYFKEIINTESIVQTKQKHKFLSNFLFTQVLTYTLLTVSILCNQLFLFLILMNVYMLFYFIIMTMMSIQMLTGASENHNIYKGLN